MFFKKNQKENRLTDKELERIETIKRLERIQERLKRKVKLVPKREYQKDASVAK